jgi:ribosomal protein L40E
LVRAGEQVLVCPECAGRPGWDQDADRCAQCGSTALRKSLGTVRCAACGHVADAVVPPAERIARPRLDLSDEVAAAVDRVLGRSGTSGT